MVVFNNLTEFSEQIADAFARENLFITDLYDEQKGVYIKGSLERVVIDIANMFAERAFRDGEECMNVQRDFTKCVEMGNDCEHGHFFSRSKFGVRSRGET